MHILSIPHGSDAYHQAVALRRRLLRAPLGLDFSPEQLQAEEAEHHFAAFDGEALAACLSAQLPEVGTVKFRQMAVDESRQSNGLGRDVLAHAERWAQGHGCELAVLHARVSAQGFYEKQGYRAEGAPFIEVTIPHVRMMKHL